MSKQCGEFDLDPANSCVECGEEATEACCACGAPLCTIHAEMGCGFCSKKHTKQESADYGDILLHGYQ